MQTCISEQTCHFEEYKDSRLLFTVLILGKILHVSSRSVCCFSMTADKCMAEQNLSQMQPVTKTKMLGNHKLLLQDFFLLSYLSSKLPPINFFFFSSEFPLLTPVCG